MRTARRRAAALLGATLVLCAVGCSPTSTSSTSTSSSPTGAAPDPTATAPTPTATTPTPTATTPTPTATTPTPTPTATTTPEAPGDLVGMWKSPSCGARKYERRINLAKDGSFTAQDLVSPCPKGVACVWSGIIDYKGTWKQEGAQVSLTITTKGTGPNASPFPTTLAIDPATKALTETTDGAKCPYNR